MKKLNLLLLFTIGLFAFSCGDKDEIEALDRNAKLISLSFDSEFIVSQPIVRDGATELSVEVKDYATEEQLKAVPVKIEVSPKANVLGDITTVDLFNNKEITFKVQAEDTRVVIEYKVTVEKVVYSKKAEIISMVFKNDDGVILTQPEIRAGETEFIVEVRGKATEDQLKSVPVELKISEKATIIDAKETFDLFNNSEIVIKVQAEDPNISAEYKLKVVKVLSSEAEITSISFANDKILEEPRFDEATQEWVFVFSDEVDVAELANTTLEVVVSEGAEWVNEITIIDLSNGSFSIDVKAEDETTKNHQIGIRVEYRTVFHETVYDFEEWATDAQNRYPVLLPATTWASSNVGLDMNFLKRLVNVKPSDDKRSGNKAAEMTTLYSKSFGAPLITAGSLFTGGFKGTWTDPDRLSFTKFGMPFTEKPIKVKGFYKYKAGTPYYRATKENGTTAEEVDGEIDQPSFSAVLYEVSDIIEGDYSEHLNGHNLNNSDKIVAKAYMLGENKDTYTEFELNLEYGQNGKTYDSSKKYRLAIVFSSSKDGDKYSGAQNSQLLIDDVTIVSE